MITPSKLEHVLDVPVHVEAVVPGPVLRVGELLALAEGSIVRPPNLPARPSRYSPPAPSSVLRS